MGSLFRNLLKSTLIGEGKKERVGRGRIWLQCSHNEVLADSMGRSEVKMILELSPAEVKEPDGQ